MSSHQKDMESDSRVNIFKITVIVTLIFVIGALAINRFLTRPSGPDTRPEFAQCLTDSGAKMYGAFWCSHCQSQKKAFGDAFAKIVYVECADRGNPNEEMQVCKDAKVDSFPTWIFGDGTRLTGEVDFKTLAEKSGCVWSGQ